MVKREKITDNAYKVIMEEKITFDNSGALVREIFHLMEEGIKTIVVDMTKIGFIDLTGMRVLFNSTKRMREHKGEIILYSPKESITRLLEYSNLRNHFEIV